ncbi:hypothetical protein N7495_004072 [Penicillium taxi]|uniref:uncharacterized protein n=1 Tax=Penicillium taxi TaxID=168475 RepID=UPI0025455DB5|nr:uncharacterized protein N7495_004072 [Penicillium taxi]KAJ5899328.1 hypothetical protein N7495_004072 [Penicillium taxi]
MTDTTRLKSTVYVGGLDQAVTAHTLAEAFVPFGELVDISLPKPDAPNSTDNHRGFGYIEFELAEDAFEAIDNMDGSDLYGRTITVAAAKPHHKDTEGLGSKTAIWEQEGYLAKYAVSDEDRRATEEAQGIHMQGLEQQDVAGPKPE